MALTRLPEPVRQALDIVRDHGRVQVQGMYMDPVPPDLLRTLLGETDIPDALGRPPRPERQGGLPGCPLCPGVFTATDRSQSLVSRISR